MAYKAPKNLKNPSLHFYRKKCRWSKVFSLRHLKNYLDTDQNKNFDIVKVRMGRKGVDRRVAL